MPHWIFDLSIRFTTNCKSILQIEDLNEECKWTQQFKNGFDSVILAPPPHGIKTLADNSGIYHHESQAVNYRTKEMDLAKLP